MRTMLLLFSTVIAYSSLAQTPAKTGTVTLLIQGIVLDSTTQLPLSYVTVVVQEAEKNETVRTTLSQQDGSFVIPGVNYREKLQLTLSYVGYKTKSIPFPTLSSSSISFGTITLTPNATHLEEVEVITLRPLIEQQFDRTIYNVEADPEANSLNTLDMLRKVPLLTVDVNDNLQLNGVNSYQILVNGKRSALFAGNPSAILKTLPASAIKKVEIITNPSARYEASGVGGVINIITNKKSISGYNGSINLGAENPDAYTAGSFLTTSAGKFSASGRYNYRYSESPTNKSVLFREDLVNRNRLEQTGKRSSKDRSQNINGEVSYQLSSQDMVTASYSQHNSKYTNNYNQLVKQQNAYGELYGSYLNLNNDKDETVGHDLSLDYEHSFKKNDQQLLSFSFNTTNSNSSGYSDIILQPVLNYKGRESTTNNKDKTKEHTIQADYVQPIGKQELEIGFKSILEKSTSNYYFKTRDDETGVFIPDPEMSNSYSYNQNIHAAYVSLNLTMGKWGLRTGARLEHTNLDAAFRSSGTNVTTEYLNLFPNITLTRLLTETSRINLSYSQRIDRPGLYSLDPYADQTDPLNISFGNPDLEPATSHALQLEYSTFINTTSINVNASHSFTSNAIELFTTLGTDSVARTTFGNIGQSRNYNFTLSGNTTLFKKLTLNLNAATNYVSYTSMLEGLPQTNEGFTYYVRGSANLRFAKTWRLSGNMSYNSPNIILQGKSGGYTWSSLALNKEFLKNNKASLSLSVRSPFQKTRRITNETVNPTFYQFRESYSVIRQFSLSFNYRFGKLK